jgi:hypothetical protein
MPFDLPAETVLCRATAGMLPKPEEFAPYAGFLDARIRYDRVKALLESVEGFTEKQADCTTSSPATRSSANSSAEHRSDSA